MDLVEVRSDDEISSHGCGTGLEVFHTAPKRTHNDAIIRKDASRAMLDVARRKSEWPELRSYTFNSYSTT